MVLWTIVALAPVALLAASSIVLASSQVTSVVNKQVQTTAAVSAEIIEQRTADLLTLVHSYATRPTLVSGVAAGSEGDQQLVQLHLASLADVADAVVTKQASHALAVTVTDFIRRPDGEPIAILGVNFGLDYLQAFTERIGAVQGITLRVTDRAGTSLTAGGANGLVSITGDPRVDAARAGRTGLLDYAPALPGGRRGPTELSAYTPVAGSRWSVVASIPDREAFAGLVRLRTTVVAIAAVLVLVLLAGLRFLARSDRRRRESEVRVRARDREMAHVLESTDEGFFPSTFGAPSPGGTRRPRSCSVGPPPRCSAAG